jgi:hypothetical protein
MGYYERAGQYPKGTTQRPARRVRQVATDNRITVGPKFSVECHGKLGKLAKKDGISVTHLIERAGYTLVGMTCPDAGTRGKRSLFESIVGRKPSPTEGDYTKTLVAEYGKRKLSTESGQAELANELLGWVKHQELAVKPPKNKALPKPLVPPANVAA